MEGVQHVEFLIIGGGLSGIAASYFIGHERCLILERNSYLGGHIHSEQRGGFTWDEGPHVSFTNHALAKALFAESVKGEYLEYPVEATNYYRGRWIPHPAQSNLFAADEGTRQACLEDFLASRAFIDEESSPEDYRAWLVQAFGGTFTDIFPEAYTEKYWTTASQNLTCDWVGERVFYPKIEEFVAGTQAKLEAQTHYIKYVRYPRQGGYFSFCDGFVEGINAQLSQEIVELDARNRLATLASGQTISYDTLINTAPLPAFIQYFNPPEDVLLAARKLSCSSVLLVNVEADHPTARPENWIYVYDRDKLSTRINCTELLSPSNAPAGRTGVQVEVYFSAYRLYDPTEHDAIVERVEDELIEMGLVESRDKILQTHTKYVQWANVIFDKPRRAAQDRVLGFLTQYGLQRETDDLHPMTDWRDSVQDAKSFGSLILAGRFAQWKYFWTDDCLLRGRQLGLALAGMQVGSPSSYRESD